jgi:membrane-bound ClpP family serine protease
MRALVLLRAAIATFWAFVTSKGIAARRRPVATGPQTIVGREGQIRGGDFVLVGGELWHADSSDGRELERGQEVRIDALEGLELTVTPLHN